MRTEQQRAGRRKCSVVCAAAADGWLRPVGGAGYGFAFGKESQGYIAFSQEVVRLKEEGEIEKILLKYNVSDSCLGVLALGDRWKGQWERKSVI